MIRVIALAILVISGGLFMTSDQPVSALDLVGNSCTGVTGNPICDAKNDTAESIAKKGINTFLFGIGILATVMIVHSGLKFVNSRGNPEGIKNAKDTLLYSVVGLIVASLSFIIVNFVVNIF